MMLVEPATEKKERNREKGRGRQAERQAYHLQIQTALPSCSIFQSSAPGIAATKSVKTDPKK